ncbi:DUF397 domain-containing protein [Streptomyces lavendulae]|uniref:DUF397 domain-containing protein n=1 Tax=Streptomyces lavendulae TaxID=1914 RepID=UPI00382F5297
MSTSTLLWFKSSHSNDSGGACVEVATCRHAIHVRDSGNLGPTLTLAPTAWADFAGWAAAS